MNNRLRPPTRATCWRVIQRALTERHRHKLGMSEAEQSQALAACDFDQLAEITFYAMADIGDQANHKSALLEKLKGIGIT